MNNRKAITLTEILIATAVFSMFMISAFGVFSSSQASFETGSWRLQRQKQAQIFLLRLKEILEKANHAYEVRPDGKTSRFGADRPIFVNANWREQVASASNNAVLFFSITTPCIPAITELGQAQRPGIWKGCALECINNTLRCYQTGLWDNMPSVTPAEVGSPDLAKFVFGNTTGDFSISLQDVGAIGVFVQPATSSADIGRPEIFVTVEVLLDKPRSKTRVQLTERITARVHDRTLAEVTTSAKGAYPLN
ncbi:MAG TPA: hypothetical protein PKM56_20295 [Candidatus Rifleibacterium sp.]|nr:hypothetical protein [Candidatus Rifleibacterium sp.]